MPPSVASAYPASSQWAFMVPGEANNQLTPPCHSVSPPCPSVLNTHSNSTNNLSAFSSPLRHTLNSTPQKLSAPNTSTIFQYQDWERSSGSVHWNLAAGRTPSTTDIDLVNCRQTYKYLADSPGTQPANSSFETQTCTTLDHGHHLQIY
jgi:hypothetical protein